MQGMALSWYPRVLSGLGSVCSLCKHGMNEFSVSHCLSWYVTEVTAKAKQLKKIYRACSVCVTD